MIRQTCTECGIACNSKPKGHPTFGLCKTCAKKMRVDVPCKKCGEIRSLLRRSYLDHPSDYCHKCAVVQPYKVIALRCINEHCKKKFTVRYSSSRDSRFSGQCPDCRGITKKQKRKTYKRVKRGEIQIHGCTLVRRDSMAMDDGYIKGRCTPYLECKYGFLAPYLGVPRSEECCHIAGKLLWEGWGVKERTENHLVPQPVISALFSSEIVEINMLNDAYGI